MNTRISLGRFASRRAPAAIAAAVATVSLGAMAGAHDFWIIPDMFAFAADATMHINGRQGGGKFPAGTPVQPGRVVDARVIGANSTTRITEMAVEGSSLRLLQKPTAAGQYLIVVGLTPSVRREPPAGVIRFLQLEGGAAEAARLERERPLKGLDTVVYTAASYAASIAQVGTGGPRAFGKAAGLRLEFVPVNDPAHVHVGDTLHVRMMGNGQPIAGIGIELAYGIDSAASATGNVVRVPFTADAKGVLHLPLEKAGPVMLRSAYASHRAGAPANEWDVSRTTYVFNVGTRH